MSSPTDGSSWWSSLRSKLPNGAHRSGSSSRNDGHDLPSSRWPRYRWRPIASHREIRIMTLLPARSSSGPIECRVEVQDRAQATDYEVVLYSPSSAFSSGMVLCDGHAIAVNPECEAALRACRSSLKRSKRLWVDAVCIDDHDLDERSAQIGHIDTVFRNAQRTIVYLGPSDTSTSLIRAMLHDVENDPMQLDRFLLHSSRVIEAWKDFFSKRWFEKPWTIPALLLSSSFVWMIGQGELSWAAMETVLHERQVAIQHVDDSGRSSRLGNFMADVPLPFVIRLYLEHRYNPARHKDKVPSTVSEKRADSTRSPIDQTTPNAFVPLHYERLLPMLAETAHFECEDPRDKLYALLPIFLRPTPELLVPNYAKPIDQVYIDLSRFFVYAEPRVLLSNAHGSSMYDDLPSWVIDWRFPAPASRLEMDEQQPEPHAGFLDDPRPVHYRISRKTLVVRGRIVDRISDLGATCPSIPSPDSKVMQDPMTIFRDLEEWDRQIARRTTDRTSRVQPGHAAAVVCTKPLCSQPHRLPGAVRHRLGLVAGPPLAAEHDGCTRLRDLLCNDLVTLREHFYRHGCFTSRERERTYDAIAQRCNGRRLIITEAGLDGIGPADTAAGDVVVVLLGCMLPFVLRPISSNHWKMMGECLVGGIMHGEAVAWLRVAKADKVVPEEPFCDFRIC